MFLLGDVFENLSNDRLKNCGLCPSHFLSALVLNFESRLNMTKG